MTGIEKEPSLEVVKKQECVSIRAFYIFFE